MYGVSFKSLTHYSEVVQWDGEGLDSQFCRADSRVQGSVYDLQPSTTTSGRVAIYEDESRGNLRSYTSRNWELNNEIGRGNQKIAASTF